MICTYLHAAFPEPNNGNKEAAIKTTQRACLDCTLYFYILKKQQLIFNKLNEELVTH